VSTNFQIGEWRVEPGLNTVSNNGTTAHLEPKVMEVLLCLAAQPGDPVSKEQLLRTVWPDTFVSDDVLTRSISELRRVFADDAKDSRFIQTIPKRGYRLIAPVISGNGDKEAPSVPTPIAKANDRTSRQVRKLWALVGSAIPLLGLLTWWQAGAIRNWAARDNAPAIHSLAVLPLQNLSGDPQQEYFADAMTEELITELSRIRALNVISRTSVMPYKQSKKSLPEIARELHADAIVEGSIVRSGDRVRVTAQLIFAAKDNNIWAQVYDRDLRDVLTLQSAVATAIAQEIRVRVSPEEQARLKNLRPVNPKALDTYANARFHLDAAANLQYYRGKNAALQEHLHTGFTYLDQAIEEDPTYLPAYIAYFGGVNSVDPQSPFEFLPKAKAALTHALQLDETCVEAHLALGRLLMQYEYDWRGAEREYRRALELNPNSGEAHGQYSEYLFNIGHAGEGEHERDLAQALDPAHDYSADAGVHRIGRTLEQDRQVLEERAPNDPFSLGSLGKGYAVEGRYKESVEMWRRCLTLYGWTDAAGVLRRAEARGGPKFALEEWMRAFEERDKRSKDVPVVPMAFTYASLGDKDRAFAWLDKAVEQRNWMIIYLQRDDVWNPLRSDPRFKALLQRVGLPERVAL
jgi:TolB-like protein/DNA-binding winged helix-turn-helix (wHTH) protein